MFFLSKIDQKTKLKLQNNVIKVNVLVGELCLNQVNQKINTTDLIWTEKWQQNPVGNVRRTLRTETMELHV